MPVGYVVQEVAWEYNDETYSRGEEGGGTPEKVFLSEAKAREFASELSAKKIKDIDVFLYCDSYSVDFEKLNERLGEVIPKFKPIDKDCYEWSVPKLSKDKLKEVVRIFEEEAKFFLYEVVEVDVDLDLGTITSMFD